MFNKIVIASWIVFIVYWAVSAFDVKRDAGPQKWWKGRISRFARLVLALILTYLYPSILVKAFPASAEQSSDVLLRAAGTALCIGGIAFAIWARRHLGRNWSGHPSLKEGHELVTTGPYNYVRHPIYTGMLAALLGSIFSLTGPLFLYFFIIMAATFVYRIHVEEGIMLRTFPEAYPAYKSRTKALIPLIW